MIDEDDKNVEEEVENNEKEDDEEQAKEEVLEQQNNQDVNKKGKIIQNISKSLLVSISIVSTENIRFLHDKC